MAIMNSGCVGAGTASDRLRRKPAASRCGGRFALPGTDASALEAAPELTALAAPCLLAMQEAMSDTGPSDRRGQALRRGADLLDRLDILRLDLLAGTMTPERLAVLSDALKAERVASDDPRLGALLAGIELRAAVEVAKLERVLPPPEAPQDPLKHRLSHFLSKVYR